MSTITEGTLLWEPSAAVKENSNLIRYMKWLESERGLAFQSYHELWQWSVTELEHFWESIWDFAHLLDDGWQEPRCVQSCAPRALKFVYVEDSEMQQIVESEKLEVLHPEYGLEPRVYYKNLYRYARCFIGGSIAAVNVGTIWL